MYEQCMQHVIASVKFLYIDTKRIEDATNSLSVTLT